MSYELSNAEVLNLLRLFPIFTWLNNKDKLSIRARQRQRNREREREIQIDREQEKKKSKIKRERKNGQKDKVKKVRFFKKIILLKFRIDQCSRHLCVT